MQPLNHLLSTLTQAKAKVEGVEGDSIEVEVMAEVVVMVEVEVKIKMSIITSPILLLMAMVKMIKAQASGGFPRRQPFCFYCKQQGAERSDHWPNRCQLLTHALKEYHDTESRTGHTDH